MKAKDKSRKYKKITLKNLIISMASILIILYSIIFYNYYFVKNEVYAKETSADISESQSVK